MLIEEAAREFLAYLVAEKGCTPLTAQAYNSDLRMFRQFLRSDGTPEEIEEITPEVLRRYIAAMSADGLAAVTRARRLYTLRSLWNYLEIADLVSQNPTRKISVPRAERHVPTYLTPAECEMLIRACERNYYSKLIHRDRAILAVLLYQGLRRSEVVGLHLSDVDLDAMTLLVRRGKGGTQRLLPLAEQAAEAIEDYLRFRPECEHSALFVTREGNPMSSSALQRMFQRTVERSDLKRKGVSLHTLRHTFATLLLKEGVDVRSLQRLLGHASIETTAQYLHLQTEDLRGALALHPLGQRDDTTRHPSQEDDWGLRR